MTFYHAVDRMRKSAWERRITAPSATQSVMWCNTAMARYTDGPGKSRLDWSGTVVDVVAIETEPRLQTQAVTCSETRQPDFSRTRVEKTFGHVQSTL